LLSVPETACISLDREMRDLRILLLFLVGCITCIAQQDTLVIFHDAVRYAKETNPEVSADTIEPQDLFMVAKDWMEDGKREKSLDLLLYLASDEVGYVLAMAKMGHLFLEQNDNDAALKWFQKAGEHNHHTSLYNAGELLSQKHDAIGALRYFQQAARLYEKDFPEQDLAKVAFDDICRHLSRIGLSLDQMRDAFIYGTLAHVPPDVELLWTRVIGTLVIKGGALDHEALVNSALALEELFSLEGMRFSQLQRFLMLHLMMDLARPISEVDDTFLPVAATYAEYLQYDQYCLYSYNESETDLGCFNTATETAVFAYREMEDEESVQRVTARAESIKEFHASP
jgi:tetratricopeptide (TPR) repeat protein